MRYTTKLAGVNFRTSKAVPKAFFPDSKKDENRSRPKNDLKENNFKKLVDYLHQHEDVQITIKDLVNRIYVEGNSRVDFANILKSTQKYKTMRTKRRPSLKLQNNL